MYKAVITDLDGTLLNNQHTVSEYTKKVINKLIDSGYKFYIATGRLHAGTKDISDAIGIKIPLITINGTRILDEEGNEIYSSHLDTDIVHTIANFDYKKHGGEDLLINGYDKDIWLVTDKKTEIYYRETRPDKPYFPTAVSEEEFKSRNYNKMHFIGQHDSLLRLRTALSEVLEDKVNIAFVGHNCLEIFNKKDNKFNAARILLERDGIDIEEAISFGDSLNDYEMLTKLGKGYIMENGIYLLKEMAPELEVIGSNDEDGEAKKILEVFNLEV